MRECRALYSLGLCAVLQVAHSADGFRLLVGVTVASMNHLGVALLATAILGVLKSCQRCGDFSVNACSDVEYFIISSLNRNVAT